MSPSTQSVHNHNEHLHGIIITCDTDWAPDFVVEEVASIFQSCHQKATFFMTNPIECQMPDCVETGIHPNFLPGSSQGENPEEILSNLKGWFPSASAVRTHSLYWYSNLIGLLIKNGIRYDSSIFMPFYKNLEPFESSGLKRLPFWWSDVLHVSKGLGFTMASLGDHLKTPGFKVFDFHAIHVWLNLSDVKVYEQIKLDSKGPLFSATRDFLERYQNKQQGIRTLLLDMLGHMARQNHELGFFSETLNKWTQT